MLLYLLQVMLLYFGSECLCQGTKVDGAPRLKWDMQHLFIVSSFTSCYVLTNLGQLKREWHDVMSQGRFGHGED